MKKNMTAVLLLVCLGAMLLASCGKPTETPTTGMPDHETIKELETAEEQKDALAELKDYISENGAELGVAYLGYNDGTFEEIMDYLGELGLYEECPFVEAMSSDDYFVNRSNELYLVVPAGKTETVRVYEAELNGETYELEKGELLGKSVDGRPFLVACNISETMPNVILETANLEYSPCLSGEDGRLVLADGIYDFSPYADIKEYFGLDNDAYTADGADPIFCGNWFCEVQDGDGELVAMTLDLYVDENAVYAYGIGNNELVEWFGGEWSFDAEKDMILLDMYGGTPEDDEATEELWINPYELKCGFKWDMDYRDDGTYLILTHIEGDSVFPGKSGATFEFTEAYGSAEEDYTYLIGSWGVIAEKSETYLELFDDGSAHYYITKDGVTETDIYGSWHAEAMTLYLSLTVDFDDEMEKPDFMGAYEIMYDGEFLTLSALGDDAFSLTDFMTENGYDSFILCGVG